MLSRKQIAYSFLTATFVIIAVFLALPAFINSDSMKVKMHAAIQEQTGGKIHYQQVEFSVLPRLSITLNQVKIDFSDQAQGNITSVQICPEFWPLLRGQVQLGRIFLEDPDITLGLPTVEAKDESEASLSLIALQSHLDRVLHPLVSTSPRLTLLIKNGALSFSKSSKPFASIKDLALKLTLDIAKSDSELMTLKSSISALTLHQSGEKIIFEGLVLNGKGHRIQDKLSFTLDELTLSKPALQLNGALVVSSASPAFSLDLQGSDIDVDATRDAALNLAIDTTPVKEIFDYLRGGKVPQISFHSQGESVTELGDLKNLMIQGQLRSGAVSIPAIRLDLTEVNGDVLISEGVLQGTNVSTRLQGSTGQEGSLKVSLVEGEDLFQMELMLSANLAEAQGIVKRIVDNPTFDHELEKITNLKGVSTGKLVLGDSLTDIHARVDGTQLNLSADHKDLPFPVKITEGQITFTEDHVELRGLQGSIGRSTFSSLGCDLNWGKGLHLKIGSAQFSLVLDELYPWLSSLDTEKEPLNEIKQITGTLGLSSLSFKGDVDNPEDWKVATVGRLRNLSIATPRFPDKINLASGNFSFDGEKLVLQQLQAKSLDADLSLSATLKGLPRALVSVELSLDGKIGQNLLDWLRNRLEIPDTYALRTPILLSDARIFWQADAASSFKGNIAIEGGPHLSLDGSHIPKQLQLKHLSVKDRHSDADLALSYSQEPINLKFTGTLQHKTLDDIFVKQTFASGQITGDFNVSIPLSKQSSTTASGHLKGEGLVIPLPSGEKIEIETITLLAEGSQIKADATSLTWDDFAWAPVKATIGFGQDKIDINISEAALCGINTSGLLVIAGEDLSLDFNLKGKALDVETSYSCLTNGRVKMTGTLDFFSKITSQGQAGELLNNLQGPLEMKFTKGLIEQSKLMARTLEVLNVTEIIKGKLPNLSSQGFAYSAIDIQGSFQGEKLLIKKIQMNGDTLNVLGEGMLDFREDTVSAELLASPFKTVDTVVRNIPGINYLMGGSLVAIPISIKGKQTDPKVRIMSASSVGSSLLSLGERVIKSPLKLIETVTPDKRGAEEE
jgi:uncharacterized protein involved in outer membrane biogenesis